MTGDCFGKLRDNNNSYFSRQFLPRCCVFAIADSSSTTSNPSSAIVTSELTSDELALTINEMRCNSREYTCKTACSTTAHSVHVKCICLSSSQQPTRRMHIKKVHKYIRLSSCIWNWLAINGCFICISVEWFHMHAWAFGRNALSIAHGIQLGSRLMVDNQPPVQMRFQLQILSDFVFHNRNFMFLHCCGPYFKHQ